jgi:hypothetical protein
MFKLKTGSPEEKIVGFLLCLNIKYSEVVND